MKNVKNDFILLAFLIILLFIVNYSYIDNFLVNNLLVYESDNVTRVIDGDTIETLNHSETIRLLGINAPEKGEKYSDKAKEFLENKILNKKIFLKGDKKDMYKRTLSYIYVNNENINLELVKEGLANLYFPSRDYENENYYNQFLDAWKDCIKENKNLCEKSQNKCANCIVLEEFNHENQKIVLKNSCNFPCNLDDWTIKDEGRKKFYFSNFSLDSEEKVSIFVAEGMNNKNTLYWKDEKYVWTGSGDTLFLRDDEGYLVLWESY